LTDEHLFTRFAPIYDTASGYLTEIPEAELPRHLSNELESEDWYLTAPKKGLCKITVPGNIKCSHFDLLRWILRSEGMTRYREFLRRPFRRFDPRLPRTILNRYFPSLGTLRRDIIEKILTKRWEIGKQIFLEYGAA